MSSRQFVFILILSHIWLKTSAAAECPKRTSLSNYCRKECTSDADCINEKRNKKCLCDGDCGLSCIRTGTRCDREPFEAPENGKRKYSRKNFGSKVKYKCKRGYSLIGPNILTCSGIGKWKPSVENGPKCLKICPIPDKIQNGRISREIFRAGEIAHLYCFPGYATKGPASVTCGADLKWNTRFPKCEVINCEEPDMPENALIRLGKRELYQYGDQVVYRCKPGYATSGDKRRICGRGTWSKIGFKCKAVSCGSPGRLENGEVRGTLYTFGNQVHYRCNEGYDLMNDRYQICQANRKWGGRKPYCKIRRCGSPPSLTNGQYDGFGDEYGSVRTAKCNVGFRLSGQSEIRCESDREWSKLRPKCEELPKDCFDLPKIENGKFLQYSVKHGKEANFRCLQGVTKVLGQPQKCDNGRLTGSAPRCVLDYRYVGCYKDSRYRSMDKVTILNKANSFASCIETCRQSNKLYTGFQYEVECWCGDQYDRNGIAGSESECNYPCIFDKRFKCGGEYRISVYKTGCTDPPIPENGKSRRKVYAEGETADYYCNDGYELIGQGPKCEMLVWYGETPKCKRKSCGKPVEISFGEFSGSRFLTGDVVTYKCLHGFVLLGEEKIYCQVNGEWSKGPTCQQDDTINDDGQYVGCYAVGDSMSHFRTVSSYGSLQSCIDFCKSEKYFYAGIGRGKYCYCGSNRGRKVGDEECQSSCVFKTRRQTWCGGYYHVSVYRTGCSPPANPDKGQALSKVYNDNSQADYLCPADYVLVGDPQVCRGYRWIGNVPSCVQGSCGKEETHPNMEISPAISGHDSEATVSCKAPYMLDGNPSVKCWYGKWMIDKKRCLAPCRKIEPEPDGGILSYSSPDYKNGSTYQLQCKIGYHLVGNHVSICKDGKWISKEDHGSCVRGCPILGKLTNAKVKIDKDSWTTKAKYSCPERLKLNGPSELICRDGKWNGWEPVCLPGVKNGGKDCRASNNPDLAAEVRYEDQSTDVRIFACPKGKRISGSALQLCRQGKWLSNQPTCVQSSCSDCMPEERPFRSLCLVYDTVFIGSVVNGPSDDGIVDVRIRHTAIKYKRKDRRLRVNSLLKFKTTKKGADCFCPVMEQTKKYLIFINLSTEDINELQVALPIELGKKYFGSLTRSCKIDV